MESLLDGRRGEKQGWDSQLWQSSPEEKLAFLQKQTGVSIKDTGVIEGKSKLWNKNWQ